jgi:predicted ATP-dependent protease
VQAVGGLHEKVEGFFDVCLARGLSGAQGVVIPRVSAGRLMQRADVVAAVEAGKFHVYAVDSVDQAIPIVMGRTAGESGPDGLFPPVCVNGRVEARLQGLAALAAAALGDKKPTETQS